MFSCMNKTIKINHFVYKFFCSIRNILVVYVNEATDTAYNKLLPKKDQGDPGPLSFSALLCLCTKLCVICYKWLELLIYEIITH